MKETIARILKTFCVSEAVISVDRIGNGHINQTYDVLTEGGRYIVQRINVFVFKKPAEIMQNIEKVTAHIAKKLEAEGKDQDSVMHFVHTADGKNFVADEDAVWRAYTFIADSEICEDCADLQKLCSAGKAFGNFQNQLADFDASVLYETIVDFHNTRARVAHLLSSIEADPCGRVAEVRKDIDAILALREPTERLCVMLAAGELPLRVTHNDTKINNVLFDTKTGEAKTVIDLDTVMPGLVAHDFGDAIRYAANTAKEDERDLSRVALSMERFTAFAEGFLGELAETLTKNEIATLSLGAFVMTMECAIRFLDDYLVGDTYFRCSYPGHNLVRARCQIRLAEEIFGHLDEMNQTVASIVAALAKK